MTRAVLPHTQGDVVREGVRIRYAVYGEGGPTILLLPTWTIVHARIWKAQVAYLARHHRVVTYDGPGNGGSDRPLDPAAYDHDRQVEYALAVLDATATDRAVLVGLSKGGAWALQLAAEHPDRALAVVVLGVSVDVADQYPYRADPPGGASSLPPSRVPEVARDPMEHWAKYDPAYWEEHHEDFLWFFFGMCLPEPRSTKPVEDAVRWGLETVPAVLTAELAADVPSRAEAEAWCRAIRVPVLAIHGDRDLVSPPARGRRVAELTGGRCVVVAGGGHLPQARDPVLVNHLVHDVAVRCAPLPAGETVRSRVRVRPRRVLYLSSPIGLGHARRDLAIARALRTRRDGLEVHWLAQDPVTRLLEVAGEQVHPASAWLASESGHVESESGEHDLHCFEALRRMDEVLVNNFHVFDDVVRDGDYDLVVADEAWEVDHFLHENPRLKRFAYAWMTDFVGFLPMPDGGDREARLTADHNAEMIEHVERLPRLRDRAVFVGDPDDVVPHSFGDGLPGIREWTERHYDFAGYVTGAGPDDVVDRETVRRERGWAPDEPVCVVTVGGSAVGGPLLHRVAEAHEEARSRVPGLRMVLVAGPRLDPRDLRPAAGLEVHAFVPDLPRVLAAADLAVVQGGLTTTMELTAARRPFLYVPLRHHFEQNLHVRHRLERYRAGRCLTYEEACDPAVLGAAIAATVGAEVDYRPVATDGAERVADLLADLV